MGKKNILFLCTGNSCRSQMAEAWCRALKGDLFNVYSAGVETHGLNPNAIKVMDEVGIDIRRHKSQHIDEFKTTPLDVVVTVCGHAHESCPLFQGQTQVVHVGFDDPPKLAKAAMAAGASEAEALEHYRRVRDDIKRFVMGLNADFPTNA
jgi:arsenate reductase (thioredoxin)